MKKLSIFIIVLCLSFLTCLNEVKADGTIPQPTNLIVYNGSTHIGNYSITKYSNWWFGNTLYSDSSQSSVINSATNRSQFYWSNIRQYCSSGITITGTITGDSHFPSVIPYVSNVTADNSVSYNCSFTKNSNNISFICEANLSTNSFGISLYYNVPSNVASPIGLYANTSYSCKIDASSIVSASNNNANNIINNANSNTNFIINSNNQNSQNVINNANQNKNDIINNNNQNTQNVINSIQGNDLDTSTIPPKQDDNIDRYESLEDSLMSNDIDIDSTISISSDSNAHNLFWDILTRLIQSHSKVFNFIISSLSIGFIKLLLCR